MCKKGKITLPAYFRHKYNLKDGDLFTLIDIGDGTVMLTLHSRQIARIGDRVAEMLKTENIFPEELFSTLEEDREQYFREHFTSE